MFPARPGGVDKKAALLAQARADREARNGQKKVEQENARLDSAARRIQQFWLQQHTKRAIKNKQRADWDTLTTQLPVTPALGLVRNLKLVFLLLRFYDTTECPMDSRRLSSLCKMLLSKSTMALEEGAFMSAEGVTPSTASSPQIASPNPDATGQALANDQQKKPMIQVPFQMILLHSRYADLAAAVLLRFLRLCITTITGNQVDSNALPKHPILLKTYSRNQVSSPISTVSKAPVQDLYLSGAELRFLMAYVDVNTYRLPETVAATIRTQMQDRGAALIVKTLDSGRFYKDIRTGMQLRSEALIQLQDRAKKTSITPAEASTQKALSLWITAIWRCCFLLQSVDKEMTEKAAGKAPGRQQRDDLINMHSDDSTVVGITCRILTIALFVECLDDLCLQLTQQSHLLSEALEIILDLRHRQYILSSMSLNETLYLLGNLTQLYRIQVAKNPTANHITLKNHLVEVIVVLLSHCGKYVSGTQTTEFRQYHPIFSWTNLSQKNQQLSAAQVKRLFSQLEYIWSRDFALEAFHGLLNLALPSVNSSSPSTDTTANSVKTGVSDQNSSSATPSSHHARVSSQTESKSGPHTKSITSDPQGALLAIEVQQACQLYMTLMRSFESQRTKILVTLMYLPSFLTQLWRFMNTLGPKGEMHIYLEAASGFNRHGLDQEPLIAILQVFCECSARFLITLDDDDMYEQQKYWTLPELVFMSGFLNQFCFAVLSQQEDVKMETDPRNPSGATSPTIVATPLPPIFYHARQVLMQLYERDSRRAFCPPNHWLLMHPTKSVFQSPLQLLAALILSNSKSKGNNGTASTGAKKNGGFSLFSSSKSPPQYATPKEFIVKVCQKDRTALQILETMPHVIPFSARLEIFREFIKEERAQRAQSLALVRPDLHQSVMVKVRRGYVLEDGYQSLGQLSANGWKNTIRVKFTNEVGAAEAGIDQGGPFKEFMESFLEAGFSPNLNLFTTTTASMNMMYPSPTSQYTHPHNGLELFRLFGKMLGKAMYEGLLIEVKFANFFLSKILGRTVFLDEMRSFDEQVFKNLMFLKKYEGDVEDLGLTFSLDEDIFGTHRSIELMRGGRDIEVTKDNRINYIFQVSDYRLNKQIQDQSRAFIDGFRSVIPLHWISIFSPQELHRVMAGDDVDFDVQDLRSYTEYQNGYFDQHPVIRNLWAVLNEFSSEEKRAFLKFVTSCSKPPLGGFKYLHPPFSIRLVVSPTTSDLNYDSTPAPAPRQLGSGATAPPPTSPNSNNSNSDNNNNSSRHQRSVTSPSSGSSSGNGFGSRLRSAFGGNSSSSQSNGPNRSSTMSTSSSASSLSTTAAASHSSPIRRPVLPSDETPAALGVVKSFFGGVLGGAGSSESSGKKARLPTSSTCFNLLKLPPFSSKSVLKEKLRYAITSNTGFELS